jgi:AmmeMemoRadiSam system protein A
LPLPLVISGDIVTSQEERRSLLALARRAIASHVTGMASGAAPKGMEPAPVRRGAAFVTIHHRGELRGCIGQLDADAPLSRAIYECAISACSADPRFPPVTAGELNDIQIELSLLGPLEPLTNASEIVIGRHGLLVEKNESRGLLLPQVAVEWHWDAETFLAQTCHKAGLPRDAWRNGAKIWRFEAEVFGETL